MPSRRSVPLGRRLAAAGLLALGALLVAPGLASADWNTWSIEILSSAPHQVSGGDALVRVGFPGDDLKVNAVLLQPHWRHNQQHEPAEPIVIRADGTGVER